MKGAFKMYKFIRVNSKTKEVSITPAPEDYLHFGNRGLVTKIMYEEVDPACDPLGPENKMIFATGLLAGTNIATAHRLSVGGKSALTNGIKESNAGGTVGRFLADLAIKAVIVEDQPESRDDLFIIHINKDGEVNVLDAAEYAGDNTYALCEKLKERFGKDISIACIGKAGEMLSKIASVQVTDFTTKHPARSAGRGGVGAIMGSKGLKALVIEKASNPKKAPGFTSEEFKTASKALMDAIVNSPIIPGMREGGTPGNGEMQLMAGVAPVRNFSGEKFEDEKIAQVSRASWVERANKFGGKQGCACQQGCVIGCSNVFNDENGEMISAGVEYETFGMFCPNLDIADWEFLAKCDRFCDDFGVDTIDLGGGIGTLMETGNIAYGDKEACLELFKEVEEGKTERAKLLLEGGAATGKAYGAKRIAAGKGQFFAAYDIRNMKGLGVSIATSTMGADHTSGLVVGPFDLAAKEGACEKSIGAQMRQTTCDNMCCSFAFDFAMNDQLWVDAYTSLYGLDPMTVPEFYGLGAETLAMEHEFNKKAGITDADDKMPEFFSEEASFTGSIWDITNEELVETKHALAGEGA